MSEPQPDPVWPPEDPPTPPEPVPPDPNVEPPIIPGTQTFPGMVTPYARDYA